MALLFIGLLVSIAAVSAALMYVVQMRLLESGAASRVGLPDVKRYRPMLRLLSDRDLSFAASNPRLQRRIRTERRAIFRGYLRCLAKEYAGLLSGLRQMMVESGVERPDLAQALAKNRVMFALALCRVEFNLGLHAVGIGKVDVSGLVEALEALRGAASVMTPAANGAF